jgi:dihydroorotate dehydrogenase electron transfer subunit
MVRTTLYSYPLLRRPFGIHSAEGDTVEIFFQKTGLGTTILSQKRKNESLDVLGPLGKGFELEKNLKGKKVIVLGGGRGIAPLYFLSQKLKESGAKVKIFYGGRSKSDLVLKDRFKNKGYELYCSTDDGSSDYKGFITDYLEEELQNLTPDYVYSCGPEAMLQKTAEITQARQIPSEFSLESIMGCGFGVCWGCVKRIRKNNEEGWHKICEQGPVFSAEEILWQDEE